MKRYWTEDERMRLDTMAQEGYSVPLMARKLDCDVMRIYNYTKGGKLAALRKDQVWTMEGIRKLFGVHKSVPYYWRERRWLYARRNRATVARFGGKAQRPQHLISERSIFNFIANRETWVAWHPSRMTDPDWQSYAADVRAHGEWLTAKQLAARYGYGYKTVEAWVARGCLDHVAKVKYGSAWFFWASDMEGFAPPLDRRYPR